MGTRVQVIADSNIYTVVTDLSVDYWALVIGAVLDEVTGAPLEDFTVSTTWPELRPRTTDGGLFALAGYVERAFPDINTTSYTVSVTVHAPGYRDVTLKVPIPQSTAFPVVIAPLNFRPFPVRLAGRVVQDTTARLPIPGAKIRFVDDPANPPVQHLVALRTPLAWAHASGITVRERALPASGAAKTVFAQAMGGDRTITLSDRNGLAVGMILRFGGDMDVAYDFIDSLAPTPANPALPGAVTLRAPLAHTFAVGATVQPVGLGAIGTSAVLVQTADAGDGAVLLDQLLDVDVVEVVDPVSTQVEYRALGALTDAQGFYHLDGIGRVKTVFMDVSATGFNPLAAPVAWRIIYGSSPNNIDFRLAP